MKRFLLAIGLLTTGYITLAQDLSTIEHNRVRLPNGWSLTPVGKSLPLGDLPLNIAVSRSGRYAAVTNNGQSTQTIQLLDAKNDRELDKVVINRSWGGLVFSSNEKYLYASGGDDNLILRYSIIRNKLVTSDTIRLGAAWNSKTSKGTISPTGIALDDAREILYVVTKLDNRLYVVDLKTKKILRKEDLGTAAYTCLLSPDRASLYITLWGGDKVAIYDTRANQFKEPIAVGDNPNDGCLSKNGRYLYVANANDNTVSVIDLKKKEVIETLNTAVYPTKLSGTTSNSVALSKDGKTLYIANADNNCIAVFNVSDPGHSSSLGFIPTGWYPSSVRLVNDKLYVANAKGFSSLPNPRGPNPVSKKEAVVLHEGDTARPKTVQYIGGGLLMGTLSIIPVPTEKERAVYSQAVYQNTPHNNQRELDVEGEAGNPIPRKVGDPSPIKYVFYVIKENRTYDQVLGDLPGGNGDTSLLLFGRRVTPNQHALAEQFVLLDNFYVDGEVSADGHNWSMGAYATDYMEKNWPTSYGKRGKGAVADVRFNKIYIWDQAARHKVSYRTYGEFVSGTNAPNIPVLKDHISTSFSPKAFEVRDTTRVRAWAREFDSLLQHNALPRLSTIRLPNDHTQGTAPGKATPFANVADNDLAVGMLVEHLSKSPVWEQSVVFILEDDAQNGPDHVDAHRSTAYVAGGFVKRGYVDHTMYSTSSMLRTMELILGLPPMTQYDAAAVPMWRCFSKTPDNASFTALPAQVDLNDVNPAKSKLAALSRGLDFSDIDRVPDAIMNEMVWKAVRGEHAKPPTPVRAAFLKTIKKADEDDDD
ncbi:bifunctional YncE family protein/alkaline phosphatase family protein [Niabella hirudinis]|uniref:bifunctional YncE family protein/alkaline phosphatase family protein n=1 Tax=Niabella hirudinis TaxID=1285929 RepID=UPI003EB8CA9B